MSLDNEKDQTNDRLQDTNYQSEALEKFGLGLQLFNALQEIYLDFPCSSCEALTPDSPVDIYINAIQKIAEQAIIQNHSELQEACLLLEDALYELTNYEFSVVKNDLLSAINPRLLVQHKTNTTIKDKNITFAPQIELIEKLADQVNARSYNTLYNISLILIEALYELSEAADHITGSDLPALLDNWTLLVSDYKQNNPHAIDNLIMVLRHPDLNLPFEDDDYETFAHLLAEDCSDQQLDTQVVTPINITNPDTVNTDNEPIIDETLSTPEAQLTPALTSSETNHTTANIESYNQLPDEDQVAPALSASTKELIELLNTEAGLLNYRFLAIAFDEPITTRIEHLQQANEELTRMANACNMVGFEALAILCQHINTNIDVFIQDVDRFTEETRTLLTEWIIHVKNYLRFFYQKQASKSLLEQMSQHAWPQPLNTEVGTILLSQMQIKNFADDEANSESYREKIATDEDISLALPDDVNKELLDLLLQELPSYTQQFSEAIQNLHTGGSSKDIDVAQRIAHTIKGSANTVGIKGIAVLTHQIEDILTACAKTHKQPGKALVDSLLNASDCLEAMSEYLLGIGEPPQNTKDTLQEILDWANLIDKNGIQVVDDQKAPISQTTEIKHVSTTSAKTEQIPKATQPEKTESTQSSVVRIPTEQIENLFRLSGESIILNGQIYERQRRLKSQLQNMEAQFTLLQQLGAELDQLIDLKDLSGRSLVEMSKDFDALEMDQYNELHTASRRMVEAAVDAYEISEDMKKELEYMNEVLEYQQRLVIDTQEAIMQTRFIPVGSIILRLQRGLRQTCRLTNKQGELKLLGENLLIDGDTLNALIEPLMHLLRNAVDHGLETEEERVSLGKPNIGQITIEFDREGNSVLIRCHDDGKGLDFVTIRHIAEQRGDIKAGETVTEDALKQLILRPNFSTRTQTTQTSGRGVGMDVVNYQVQSLGGSLSLHSEQGKGLTVEIRVPLPLSRSHALLAYAARYKVAIASKGITQILYTDINEIKTMSGQEVLVIGEDIYPVVKLEELLHVEDRRKSQRAGAALLVQNAGKITAVLVSNITDSREVVIKHLGYYMRKIHGFVGATILGDGSVTPVLDLPELLRAPATAKQFNTSTATGSAAFAPKLPTILIVDDSLSQRRALEQILTDAGFRVHEARDGIEASEWLTHVRPEVVITDLEMPKMNGIELTSHIRTQAKIKNLPIIMITSRSTQKHRQMAEEAGVDFYLVKPVQDDDLLTKIQSLIDKQHKTVTDDATA